MKLNTSNLRCLAVAVLFGWIIIGLGCSGDSDAIEPSAAQATPAGETQVTAAGGAEAATSEPETFPVPDGTPDELFAFLEGLASKEPPARDPESMQAFVAKLGNTVVVASDRILAAKPSAEQASEAVNYKLAGLGLMEQAGDASAKAKRAAMPAQLEAAGLGSLVRLVKVDEFISRFRGLRMAKTKDEFVSFAEDFAKFLEQSPPDPEDIDLARQFADTLERVLDPEEVAKYYERYGKAFAGIEDEQVVEAAAMMAGSARRLRLVGKEMPLEGVTLDGEELQWDKYKGKVVLVDFWATWCGPCIQEMGNILENYRKYHDRGFDVVGINVDETRDPLVSFLKDRELPWIVVFDEDLKSEGRETMATRYGVASYPTVMLVGKDGKVVTMDVRGPELGARLEELLGKVDPPAAPVEVPKDPAPKEPAAKEPAAKEPAAKEPAAKEPAAKEPDEPKSEGS